jgi:hypothetical protein
LFVYDFLSTIRLRSFCVVEGKKIGFRLKCNKVEAKMFCSHAAKGETVIFADFESVFTCHIWEYEEVLVLCREKLKKKIAYFHFF